jgi:hypothetical protein
MSPWTWASIRRRISSFDGQTSLRKTGCPSDPVPSGSSIMSPATVPFKA